MFSAVFPSLFIMKANMFSHVFFGTSDREAINFNSEFMCCKLACSDALRSLASALMRCKTSFHLIRLQNIKVSSSSNGLEQDESFTVEHFHFLRTEIISKEEAVAFADKT